MAHSMDEAGERVNVLVRSGSMGQLLFIGKRNMKTIQMS